jgi:hypothetical protein
LLRHHYGEDVDISPAAAEILALASASHWARGLVAAQHNRRFSTVGRLDR